jgi:hypothetical protein
MAYLFQSSIIFAVMASNIEWHWAPPHSYVPALAAFVAAYIATALLNGLINLLPIKRTGDSL